MTDIVERLRCGVDTNEPPDKTDRLMAAAADEIERLRDELGRAQRAAKGHSDNAERLRTALGRLVNDSMYQDHPEASQMAIDALTGWRKIEPSAGDGNRAHAMLEAAKPVQKN